MPTDLRDAINDPQPCDVITRHDGAGQGRIRALVSAVQTMACSDELLAGIADLAKARDVPTHAHSHISEGSAKTHLGAFHRTETQRLQDAGMLTARCTLMHSGWLSDDDIAAFHRAGVTVNHNPVGNAMLGFGTDEHKMAEAACRALAIVARHAA